MAREENKNLKYLSLSLEQKEIVVKAREAVESAKSAIVAHKAKRSDDIQGLNRKNKKEYIEKHKKDLLNLQRDLDQKYLDLCALEEELGISAWRRQQVKERFK